MNNPDYSHIVFESDLLRARLQQRARAIKILQTLITCRRDDWHFYLTKRYLCHEPRLSEAERAEMARLFAEHEDKLMRLRKDIRDMIRLVREIDSESYNEMGSTPEH